MSSYREIPRLTGSLRINDKYFWKFQDYDYHYEIKCRRNAAANEQRMRWKTCYERAKQLGHAELLKELQKCAKDYVNDEFDEDTLISVAFSLYDLFKDTRLVRISDSSVLKERFGSNDHKLAERTCSIVSQIVFRNILDKDAEESSNAKKVMFGETIKVYQNEPLVEQVNIPESIIDSDIKNTISAIFKTPVKNKVVNEKESFDERYLEDQLKSFGDFSDDLKAIVLESLMTSTDDELQDMLLNLMGLEHINLVTFIICNRETIIRRNLLKKRREDISRLASVGQAPAHVTIRTKEENLALKQIRKEEKRKRQQNKSELYETDVRTMESDGHGSLLSARSKPLFPESRPVPNYPFVFDKLSEIKRAPSFLSGEKVLLPENTERLNTRGYERIHLPAPKSAYDDLADSFPLISVNSLSDIFRIVFDGITTLNFIQSVVFHGASESNENLLVCAPTGAGKTNIALLCIANEINKNIRDGLLQKDKFKIVYITPMKALAAEVVTTLKKRLAKLNVIVRELTGDMQLTRREIAETQLIVTTPEKWDVITRKGSSEEELARLVKLVIIDEIHLLNDDRGAVIECIVARTLKQVEQSQDMIRIVGLSATLPNYLDVANFLRVNLETGLYYFDNRFRPVPLDQTFVGVKSANKMQLLEYMDEFCYEEVRRELIQKNQVIVFVHARNATKKTADILIEKARNRNELSYFNEYSSCKDSKLPHVRNRHLVDLISNGVAIHHAGLARSDRDLVERYFREGVVRVLVCTATLAWGVNLPAHAVIIKGTQIYDSKRSTFVDMSVLDILQIFGRAGRPQFDTSGHGIIITPHDKLSNYLRLIMMQNPIESQLIKSLTDCLNAEIVLGTVTNIEEGISWLKYTYLYIRLRTNPMAYGISYKELHDDPSLETYCRALIVQTARILDKSFMIRFNEKTEFLHFTDLGRIASHYYIAYSTIEIINEKLTPMMNEAELLWLVSTSTEFSEIKVREDEMDELEYLHDNDCKVPVFGGVENNYGKTNILMQAYIARSTINNFSLSSDLNYISQNTVRIMRALFEIAVKNNSPLMASRCLNLSKTFEQRMWYFDSALRQIDQVPLEAAIKLEEKKLNHQRLTELSAQEIGAIIHHMRMGDVIKEYCACLPMLDAEAVVQPITRSILRVTLTLTPCFKWNDSLHGTQGELYWIWVEDPNTDFMYYSEQVLISRKQVKMKETVNVVFAIPISEPLPPQYIIRCLSNRWIDCDTSCLLSFKHLILPERHLPHTTLLDLDPLPVSVLGNSAYESFYRYSHFNPIQTQVFHCVYHTDNNILLGAPTGSGKTVIAEIAIFRLFNKYPGMKTVYIAPLKALVRERLMEWKEKFQKLEKRVVELTGDFTPDVRSIINADIIITTPEKWDGISRSWQTRSYVKDVGLMVIDEIHLLGEDRGPVLEVIVSRTNFISSHTEKKLRIIGLSTAVANAVDLADWLSIKKVGLYNFKPSVRPVPLEVHISGFPGKHYCPRMATMNKPAFQAIKTYSNEKPVLIFVSSRRQTRLTALELISHLAVTGDSKQWLQMPENEINNLISSVIDPNLQLTLAFGIGIHHAGLAEKDRKLVEELFVNMKIQVLVATSTLAWGVNFPAHLVIIKGTEYYDGKSRRYIDFPITDVLQMMGRAGRPQYDDQGVAVIMVQDTKKDFYKKFLYEPFPVESSLLNVISDHLNAEIVAGTINTKQEAIDYLTWTYFFRRILVNPTYYGINVADQDSLNSYLSSLIERSVTELKWSYCIEVDEDDRSLSPTIYGRIASYYYLSHETMKLFRTKLTDNMPLMNLIRLISDAKEYAELPVRHNEDQMNCSLAKLLNCTSDSESFDSPHVKTFLLLNAHFSRVKLPVSDYYTDLKSVLDQILRIVQGLLDIAADFGWLSTALRIVNLMQMSVQARWIEDSSLLSLPGVDSEHLCYFSFENSSITCLPQLLAQCEKNPNFLLSLQEKGLPANRVRMMGDAIKNFPRIEADLSLTGKWADNNNVETRSIDDAIWKSRSLPLCLDEEYALNVNLIDTTRFGKRSRKVTAPLFPKIKEEGWIGMIGEVEGCELWALKRIPAVKRNASTKLIFITPSKPGRYEISFYLMSDCYLGLDQQYNFYIEMNEHIL